MMRASLLKSMMLNSTESGWYEGAHIGSSNNQGIEGKNRDIKASHTFRSKAPLGSFIDTMLRMVHEWSLEDSSLLDGERQKILPTFRTENQNCRVQLAPGQQIKQEFCRNKSFPNITNGASECKENLGSPK